MILSPREGFKSRYIRGSAVDSLSEALQKAREIAARLSGKSAVPEEPGGKRKRGWGDDGTDPLSGLANGGDGGGVKVAARGVRKIYMPQNPEINL